MCVSKDSSTDKVKTYAIDSYFDKVTVWEHDVPPQDTLLNTDINDWFDIARAVSEYLYIMCFIKLDTWQFGFRIVY